MTDRNITSNLVTNLEAWIDTAGRGYGCGRDYPGNWRKAEPNCACCLIIAAVRALKSNAVETPADAVDAARYRWLRAQGPTDEITVETFADPNGVCHLGRDELDSAVDAARGALKTTSPQEPT